MPRKPLTEEQKIKKREYDREYSRKPEVKKKRKEYSLKPEVKEKRKQQFNKRMLDPVKKERVIQTRKIASKKYRDNLDPAKLKQITKEKDKEYNSRPEVKEKKKAYKKEYRKRPEVVEREKKRTKEYNKKYFSSERYKQKVKERYINEVQYRLVKNERNKRRRVLKKQQTSKKVSYIESLGCTTEFFKSYIESLWLPGMTWENYGKGGWHIDEIRPCASFDLSDPEQYKQCFHYSNAQPLWEKDNIIKNSWWEGKRHKHKKN